MRIEPLGARVLVRILEQEHMTPGGLVLPETAQEKPMEGIVEAVGSEDEMISDLAVGDKILFAKYSGTEVKADGVEYLLMNEDDILARLRDD